MSWSREKIKSWLLKDHNAIISRPPGQFSVTRFKLDQAKSRGLKISYAIDGGAANGGWTREIKAVFPDCTVLCIEPREDAQAELRQFAAELPSIHIAKTLIGDFEGEVELHGHAEQSSILLNSAGQAFGTISKEPMTTLDKLVEGVGLGFPDLIKLDLQGAELRALAGADNCLNHASAVELEVSFIPLQKSQPLLADVVAFMGRYSFRCYDILGLWHRPLDGALVQGDFFFVHERSGLLNDNRWSVDSEFA